MSILLESSSISSPLKTVDVASHTQTWFSSTVTNLVADSGTGREITATGGLGCKYASSSLKLAT